MLGSFGVQGAEGCTLVPVCVIGSLVGAGGCGMDCFGCILGLFGVSPAHGHGCLSFWAD